VFQNASFLRVQYTKKALDALGNEYDQPISMTEAFRNDGSVRTFAIPAGANDFTILGFDSATSITEIVIGTSQRVLASASDGGTLTAPVAILTPLANGKGYFGTVAPGQTGFSLQLPVLPNSQFIRIQYTKKALDNQGREYDQPILITQTILNDGVERRFAIPAGVSGYTILGFASADTTEESEIGTGLRLTSRMVDAGAAAGLLDVLSPLANGRGYFGTIAPGRTGLRVQLPVFPNADVVRIVYTKKALDDQGNEYDQPVFASIALPNNGGGNTFVVPAGVSGYSISGYRRGSPIAVEIGTAQRVIVGPFNGGQNSASVAVLSPLANGRGYVGTVANGQLGFDLELPVLPNAETLRVTYTRKALDARGQEYDQPVWTTDPFANDGLPKTFAIPAGVSGYTIEGFRGIST
jgi:hypothetical protein